MIDGPAATNGSDFCSRERHTDRLSGTEAEPVQAWQDANAPNRPAHQADHAAHYCCHFMNALVPETARYELPDNQAG